MSAIEKNRSSGTARRIGEVTLAVALLACTGFLLWQHPGARCDAAARNDVTLRPHGPAAAYRSGLTSGFYAPVLDRAASRTG